MRIEDSGCSVQGEAGAATHPTTSPHPESRILNPVIHSLGLVDYTATWDAMKRFTAERTAGTRDEIWLLQHPPVYTQGLAGLPEHLLHSTNIPVVKIDRGGQITYHGPGQIVAYLLLDMRRWKIGVRELVTVMENSVIDLLAEFGVHAANRVDAPGVYVNNAKIAALGLKIKHGCCYHGLSFNVDMDLSPFASIIPCGYQGLKVTQVRALGITATLNELQAQLAQNLVHGLQNHLRGKTPCP
ncbi:MAG: lipoyl(octanoyl) transferase LipB [Gallionella sp.]|jgi:lipoyl(octanoyl) transferase|nr:lipoyl(octanoyl) transferase LipB [Gallionella sp.]